MAELDSVVRDFLVESHENLDGVDQQLVQLEDRQGDPESIAAIFRTIHTIKGTCGFLGFGKLEHLAHAGEDLLSRLRDGRQNLNPAITGALLDMVDAIRRILAQIEESGSEGDEAYASLCGRLQQLTQGTLPEAAPAEPAVAVAPAPSADVAPPVPVPGPPTAGTPPPGSLGALIVQRGFTSAAEVEAALIQQANGDPRRIGEILIERGSLQPEQLVELLRAQQGNRGGAQAESSIRVPVGLLDRLMNLVGELVLTRNQILQLQGEIQVAALQSTAQRLNQITTELQEGVMQTRMQPIGTLLEKFPRMVRDLAQATGKRVIVQTEGRETELDKNILETIKDPLTHIIRNAIDHGIEEPELRVERGKAPEGQVAIRAFHEGGQVNIQISDDGNGIDPERVRAKAVQKGLFSADRAARMSDQELMQVIFAPGFSTAEQVTQLSGRGVGMDVVKTNIEKIGGTIDVHGTPGRGTTIHIKIPLTLAIIPALIVRCEAERFAIAQVSLVELVRLDPEQKAGGIEWVHGAPVHRLRGELLPLVFLSDTLKLPAAKLRSSSGLAALNIVVLQEQKQLFGLVVDEVTDTQEIVVKPLGRPLNGIDCFAGATIMGDGRVALILDVQGIARRSGVHGDASQLRALVPREDVVRAAGSDVDRLLLFSVGERDQMALPLSRVQRLEEFQSGALERAGHLRAVKYRGRVLPLVDLREHFGRAPDTETPGSRVIVCRHADQNVGFVVREIIDIIEEAVLLERCSERPGVLGSAIVAGRVTDLLDPDALAALAQVGEGRGLEPPA
jgi:two-component system chemotaxis sensor kinase CheA